MSISSPDVKTPDTSKTTGNETPNTKKSGKKKLASNVINSGNTSTPKSMSTIDRLRRKVENRVYFDQIGGLATQIQLIRSLLICPVDKFDQYKHIGKFPPQTLLLHGLPGTGKSMVIEAFITQYSDQLTFFRVDCRNVLGKSVQETEQKLQELFDAAQDAAPRSVLIIDDMDMLFPSKKNANEQDKRLLWMLCNFLDSLNEQRRVLVIGITCKLDQIDVKLRRSRRFDREIEFNVPLMQDRLKILHILLAKCEHNLTENQVIELAKKLIAYTGADLDCMISMASLNATQQQNRKKITFDDLLLAQSQVKPSAMREILLEVPCVRWNEIGGMQQIKDKLMEALIWPIKYANIYNRFREKQPKGILMYGPPGCSKTMIGKALATECDHRFITVKGPEIFNKYVGESEKTVREIFEKARQIAPSIIFFDEIDSIAINRGQDNSSSSSVNDKVVSTLLNEMDGMEVLSNVFIVATTNRPDVIDTSLLRTGRLDSIIYVPLPDFNTRKEIFRIRLEKLPLDFDVPVQYCIDQVIEILDPVFDFHSNERRFEFIQSSCADVYESDRTDTDSNHSNVTTTTTEEHSEESNVVIKPIAPDECVFKDNHYGKERAEKKSTTIVSLSHDFEKISIDHSSSGGKDEGSGGGDDEGGDRSRQMARRFDFMIKTLAELTEGYSGAEITTICHEAFVLALRNNVTRGKEMKTIAFEFYLKAVRLVKPRTNKEMVTKYEQFARNFAQNSNF